MSTVAKLLVRLVVVAFVVTFATFGLLDQAPGDPAAVRAGLNATEENIERIQNYIDQIDTPARSKPSANPW